MTWRVIEGDALAVLPTLEAESVQCAITSPPYFGLRDYGTATWEGGDPACGHVKKDMLIAGMDGSTANSQRQGRTPPPNILYSGTCGKCGAVRIDQQIGLEPTVDEYVAKLVAVFREVRRVLRKDGTLWLNIGDSYAAGGNGGHAAKGGAFHGHAERNGDMAGKPKKPPPGLKPKDLIGVPWALAKALRDPYYAGCMKKERDRVWMAAMIDGEGCISGFTHDRKDDGRTRTGVNITITNTNAGLIAEADRIWPASIRTHQKGGRPGHLGKRDTLRWIVNGTRNRLLFLREIYPYLVAKRRQAIVAYNLLLLVADAKRIMHSEQAGAVRERRAFLISLISDLNQARATDLPGWLVEPPSVHEPGWYLRQDIIWSKPNPMPESVQDRCTKAHEYLFLLSKSAKYAYDAEAIAEEAEFKGTVTFGGPAKLARCVNGQQPSGNEKTTERRDNYESRNKRSVWTVTTQPNPCPEKIHFAVMPEALVTPCILAGSKPGDLILDPFAGAGTVGVVADRLGRDFVGIELSGEYARMARKRIANVSGPLFQEEPP